MSYSAESGERKRLDNKLFIIRAKRKVKLINYSRYLIKDVPTINSAMERGVFEKSSNIKIGSGNGMQVLEE